MLSDHTLPSFDGLSALKLANVMCPEVPFILISGAIGEERAIEALKSGATDYVLKQRLERLVPTVRRAVREGEQQIQRDMTVVYSWPFSTARILPSEDFMYP
jgi:DNA-binding NtrC family response regulator